MFAKLASWCRGVRMCSRILFSVAAINGLFVVAFGAFSAHMLSQSLDAKHLGWIHTGIAYQAWHTVVIMALSSVLFQQNNGYFFYAGLAMLLGILLFSGSLYLLALAWLPSVAWYRITPGGGMLFLLGWLLVLIGALRRKTGITDE